MAKGMVAGVCLVLAAVWLQPSTGSNVLWSSSNCGSGSGAAVAGTVTDAICANYTTCKDINKESGGWQSRQQTCDAEAVCLWKAEQKKCVMNRDGKNNVCVPNNADGSAANINPICHDMTRGICPRKFQVKKGCCTGSAAKYNGVLLTENDDVWVCCNLPCQALANSSLALPTQCLYEEHTHLEQCGPSGRSVFGGGDDYTDYDVPMPADKIQNMLGMNPGKTMSLGMANDGFGYMGMNNPMGVNALEEVGVGQSKESHTEEITVDDLFEVLTEALSKDKDVFGYKREINSDPWFAKQSYGGFKNTYSLVDPWKFIDTLYGSPFGMAQGASTFGNLYRMDQTKYGGSPGAGHQNYGGWGAGAGAGYGSQSYGGFGGYGGQASYGSGSYGNVDPYGAGSYSGGGGFYGGVGGGVGPGSYGGMGGGPSYGGHGGPGFYGGGGGGGSGPFYGGGQGPYGGGQGLYGGPGGPYGGSQGSMGYSDPMSPMPGMMSNYFKK